MIEKSLKTNLFEGDEKIVGAWMRADVDAPSPESYIAASRRLEKARRAPAPVHDPLLADAQIVAAWVRDDDHGPSPEEFLAASKRIEEAGNVGEEIMESQRLLKGGKILRTIAVRCSYYTHLVKHFLLGVIVDTSSIPLVFLRVW